MSSQHLNQQALCRSRRLLVAGILGAALLLVALAGCGGAARATSTPQPTLTPTPSLSQLSVYVGACGGTAGGSLASLNAADGTFQWKAKVGTFCAFLPNALANGVLYVAGDSVRAINAADGTVLWTHDLGTGARSVGPTVVDGTVYVRVDTQGNRYLYALDARDGSQRWRISFTGSSFLVANGVVYAGQVDVSTNQEQPFLGALSTTDGSLLWKQKGDRRIIADSVIDGTLYGHTYSFPASEQPPMFYLAAYNAADGTPRWSQKTTEDPVDMVVDHGVAYLLTYAGSPGSSKSYLSALNVADGSSRWHVLLSASTCGYGPLVSGTTLYIGCGDHYVYALAAPDGSSLWKYQTGGQVYAAAALRNDTLFALGGDSAYALRASDGTLVWHTQVASFPTGLIVAP